MDRGIARLLVPALAVAVAWSSVAPSAARAQAALVGDPEAEPAVRPAGAAVAMLVRSMLVPSPRRPLVARAALLPLLETLSVSGRARGLPLVVEAAILPQLMERLPAVDRVFLWRLETDGDRLRVSGEVLGTLRGRVAEIKAAAPAGEWAALARQVAGRLAPALEAGLDRRPGGPPAALGPAAAAAGMLAVRDAAGARQALALLGADVPETLRDLRDAALAVLGDDALPAEERLGVALGVGDGPAALALADRLLVATPDDGGARAARVRALLAAGRLKDADEAAARLSRRDGAAHEAVLLLALRAGGVGERDRALGALLGDEGRRRRALALLGGAPPGSFGPAAVRSALDAARGLAGEEPVLAGLVALHAARAGVEVGRALELLRPQDLDLAALRPLRALLEERAVQSGRAETLRLALEARETVARGLKAEAGIRRPAGPPTPLALALLPFVEQLGEPRRPSLESVLVAPLAGSGQEPYWPLLVRPDRLRDALEVALAGKPHELDIVPDPGGAPHPESAATASRLGELLAGRADAAVLYRLRPAGRQLAVHLLVFDASSGELGEVDGVVGLSLAWTAGLVAPNPVAVAVAAALVLALLVGLVRLLAGLRGAVVVSIRRDASARDEVLAIFLTRSSQAPQIGVAASFESETRAAGPEVKRTHATLVGEETTFRGLLAGAWTVHLVGTYREGAELKTLDPLSEPVRVLGRGTATVRFDLDRGAADFVVDVADGDKPVPGAVVYVDDNQGKAQKTNAQGRARVAVPRGRHTIWIEVRGLRIARPMDVANLGEHDLQVNLAWERRVDDVSRALEAEADPQGGGIVELPPRKPGGGQG